MDQNVLRNSHNIGYNSNGNTTVNTDYNTYDMNEDIDDTDDSAYTMNGNIDNRYRSIYNIDQNRSAYNNTADTYTDWNELSSQNSGQNSMSYSSQTDTNNSNLNFMYNKDWKGFYNDSQNNAQKLGQSSNSNQDNIEDNNQIGTYTKWSTGQDTSHNIIHPSSYINSRNIKTNYNADQTYTNITDQNTIYGTDNNFTNQMNHNGNTYNGGYASNCSKAETQRKHSDMIIILSLLKDICTAVENVESINDCPPIKKFRQEDMYPATVNTQPSNQFSHPFHLLGNTSTSLTNSNNSTMQQQFGYQNFDEEELDEEDYETEEYENDEYENEECENEEYENEEYENEEHENEVYKNEEYKNEEYKNEEYKNEEYKNEEYKNEELESNIDENVDNDHSFEELSDETDDDCIENRQHISVIQGNKKMKIKRKSRNQRKNIRNVFSDKQLDATTKLLREKEQERLQRLGLNKSIDNTGKVLRATAAKLQMQTSQNKFTHPISNILSADKKPSEVICLVDSDSDDSTSNKYSKILKPATKEPILVLSSDSDEEEDSSDPVFDELVQSEDYYSELGLHTNDALNVRDKYGRVLVNVNHSKADDDVFLHRSLGDNLKPHQIGGVRFLYDNLIESVSSFRRDEGNGCILAHAMGLGKTIETITFIDLFLRYTSAKKVLCVVPVNTIQNWMCEFNRWLPAKPDDFKICDFNPKTVPKATTPKGRKSKKAAAKKQEEDHAIIQELLEDMVDYVVKKQVSADVTDTVNQMLNEICLDENNFIDVDNTKTKPIPHDGYRTFHVFLIDAQRNQFDRAKIIEEWDRSGGVLLVGYEMYRSIAMYKVPNKFKAKPKKGKRLTDENGDVLLRLKKAICKPGPDLVVCDEGHRIRNYQSGISQALKSIKTRKRLVLTGYPLQNNLIEYWCMVDFVRPNYLGSRQEFANMFERPIMNGQCVDSTPKDKHVMKQRAHVLYSLLQGFVQRRGHDVFSDILPKKEEHVLLIRLAPIQKALYKRLIELTRDAYNDSLNPIKTFSLCCKIWNHPDILYEAILQSQQGNKVDIISDQDDICIDEATGRQKRKRKQPNCLSPIPNGMMMGNVGFDPYGTEAKDLLTDIMQWAGPIFKRFPFKPGNIGNSGKFYILKNLLDQTLLCGEKMLVFSQSLLTLDVIERMLKESYKSSDNTNWKKGRDYFRLDGGTSTVERERMINSFNDENNHETKLFVLSTRAGCLGINLVAANRVVVFDVSWNPCHDAQAVCRIYRYGQTKPCYIYRLVSSNTMEKKIYYRQISKQGISDRVVDEMNLTENFSRNEIQSLVIEDWEDEEFLNFSSSAYTFSDHVLVNTLLNCNLWITKFPFKHESLLINESATKLSGSEKRAAKREYEQERMMSQGAHIPFRTYPLQQNFPRNTPIAPVKPFLWRPPLNQSASWLHTPSSLFHHTVSHNVTVPSSFPPTDPLQVLRQGPYTGDHSYTETGIPTSIGRESNSSFWRSAFTPSALSSLVNRNQRSLFNLANPLSSLTDSVEPNNTIPSLTLSNMATSAPMGYTTFNQESTGTAESCPPDDESNENNDTNVAQTLYSYRPDEKCRVETNEDGGTNGIHDTQYHSEQSLNFEDNDYYDSSGLDNSNDTFAYRDSQNNRNFEVIVLDDDEDD